MARIAKELNHRIKQRNKDGICRIIENGKGCSRATHCRGLCAKHHTYFLRWGTLNDYGAPQKFVYVEEATYVINKAPKQGLCRITENGKSCSRKVHGRGLCARHWLTFERHGLLATYGSASRKDPRTFRLKKKIVKGVCRMIENNKSCPKKTTSRGLCSKHYLRFLRNGEIEMYGVKSANKG